MADYAYVRVSTKEQNIDRQLAALAAETSFAFSTNAGSSELRISVDNDGVIQELRSLRGEMNDMAGRLARMQVVLDTGVLVGETVGPLDAALGSRVTRSWREREA